MTAWPFPRASTVDPPARTVSVRRPRVLAPAAVDGSGRTQPRWYFSHQVNGILYAAGVLSAALLARPLRPK